MNFALRFHEVTKRFGSLVALDRVSLDVPRGSVCALLGANGAGKTTALKILLGLISPDAGSTEVLGLPSREYSLELRRRVSYVADRPPLYDWMTVSEMGWFASGFHPPGFDREYLLLCGRFGLTGSQKIKHLSKGGRAKVALALAMAPQPELLILDEPTSGLDPLVRREFLESMVDVAAQGRTVLLSSHQVAEVERVADVAAIMIHGRLVCVEPIDELVHSTREVLATLPDVSSPAPEIPGMVLAHQQRDSRHVWLVRHLEEDRFRATCPHPLEIREPGLEDILLALLKEERRTLPSDRSESVPPAGVQTHLTSAAR